MESHKGKRMELAGEISSLCCDYRGCRLEAENKEKTWQIRVCLESLCKERIELMDISYPALLIALMDAYEITQDEGMLQKVLDIVSREAGRLEPSADHVRLLSYCYYYVEDEECADLAREMLRTLKERGDSGEVGRAEQVYHELVEENHPAM